MSKLIKARIRHFLFLCLVAGVIGGVSWWQLHDTRALVVARMDKLQADASALGEGLSFGDFSTQSVDNYLANLNQKLRSLDNQIAVYDLQLANTDILPWVNVADATAKKQQVELERERYRLDSSFMGLSSLDYRFLRLHTGAIVPLRQTLTTLAAIIFNLKQTLIDPTGAHPDQFYVQAGDIIGTQGCTGVCSGTHVHFAVAIDNKPVDPCTLLNERELSRWGVDSNCGQPATQAKLRWPVIVPWIISDTFDSYSAVTGDHHEALDLIDREYGPVVAALSGWYYHRIRDCSRGIICNDGYAKIVSVCENQDCKKGIRTEYWHLDWMVSDSVVLAPPNFDEK